MPQSVPSFSPDAPDFIGFTAFDDATTGDVNWIAEIRKGIPYDWGRALQEQLDASQADWARWLGMSERTLRRRKDTGRFAEEESDQLYRIVNVYRLAVQAFESAESARRWLVTPHTLLGGEAPLDHLDTQPGTEQVKDLLYGIEYSMPA